MNEYFIGGLLKLMAIFEAVAYRVRRGVVKISYINLIQLRLSAQSMKTTLINKNMIGVFILLRTTFGNNIIFSEP